jgi:hypothetical protein
MVNAVASMLTWVTGTFVDVWKKAELPEESNIAPNRNG